MTVAVFMETLGSVLLIMQLFHSISVNVGFGNSSKKSICTVWSIQQADMLFFTE